MHRQTACAAIKHMALGVYGFGCEDALIHLLNHVWPNVFETSPHLVQAFMDAVDGLRVALGPIKILQYTLQVRSHVCQIRHINNCILFLINVWKFIILYNFFLCRAYSILLAKFVTCTGRFIILFTSADRTLS